MTLPPTVLTIMQQEADAAHIPVTLLQSRSQTIQATAPRQRAMWRCRNEITIAGAPASLVQIGRWFGRDHTTVLHALRRVDATISY